jgi:hypothetical protein
MGWLRKLFGVKPSPQIRRAPPTPLDTAEDQFFRDELNRMGLRLEPGLREPLASPLAKRNGWSIYKSDLHHDNGDLYMKRWILTTPWFNIRLHKIVSSDRGRDFHDHPFDFTSCILWGGYTEFTPPSNKPYDFRSWGWRREDDYQAQWHGPGSIVRRKATDLHRLELSSPAWTLVFASRYKRNWGFQTATGWIEWSRYDRSYYNEARK